MCELWPYLGEMALSRGHDTPLGHWQQLFKIYNIAVLNYYLDMDFVTCEIDLKALLQVWIYKALYD